MTGADVQHGQYELKLDEGITSIPTIDFNEETLEYKNANCPDSSEAATLRVQKTVKIPQIRDREHSDGFCQLEADI